MLNTLRGPRVEGSRGLRRLHLDFWIQNQQSKVSQPVAKYLCVSRNAGVGFSFWIRFKVKAKIKKLTRSGCLVLPCGSETCFALPSLSFRACWIMQHPNLETRHPLQTDEQQETGFDPLHDFNKNHSSTQTRSSQLPFIRLSENK